MICASLCFPLLICFPFVRPKSYSISDGGWGSAQYEDRLEGRITPEMYDRKARELREQALELSRRINEVQASAPAPVQDAIDLMDLTSRAADLFLIQPAPEKQRFMRLVMKGATWRDGQLQTQFEEPFENLRRSNQLSLRKHEENGMRNAEIANWLPSLDTFRTYAAQLAL
jgi:hypothetical protein